MIRWWFRFIGLVLTGKIVASGSPGRIASHAARRQAHKALGKWLR